LSDDVLKDRRKKWLLEHRDYRNHRRKTYYASRRFDTGGFRYWEQEELDLLRTFRGTDTELALALRRSVQAIQVKRCYIKSKETSK
jgi:hypothetical protein